MAIAFAEERYDDAIAEIREMAARDGHLVAPVVEGVSFALDHGIYKAGADAKVLALYVARDEGRMVGFAWFFVGRTNPHYAGVNWASGSGVWLEEAARKFKVASRFLDFVESALADRGMRVVQMGAKPGSAMARLLCARRHRMTDLIFTRELQRA